MNIAQQLQQLKDMSIKREAIKQKVNALRRQKNGMELEIDDLVNQMILED